MPGPFEGYAHLRVRISESDKEFLRQLSAKSGQRPNVSRAVKLLIANARQKRASVDIDPATRQELHNLAKILRRTPSQVMSDAVSSILEMVHEDELPLIVLELRLAQKFLSRKVRIARRPPRARLIGK